MMKRTLSLTGAAALLVAALASTASANLVLNPGFEANDGTSAFDDWIGFGSRFVDGGTVHAGSSSAKLFGQFVDGVNFSGLVQTVTAAVGEEYTLGAFLRTNSGDSIDGTGNAGGIKIEFFNAADVSLGFIEDFSFDGSIEDAWVYKEVSMIAPAGTDHLEAVMIFRQSADEPRAGSVFYDSVSLTIPEPASFGVFAIFGAAALVRRRR